jgi:hypothetical protein
VLVESLGVLDETLDLKSLAASTNPCSVSIYLPLQNGNLRQNRSNLKALISLAQKRMAEIFGRRTLWSESLHNDLRQMLGEIDLAGGPAQSLVIFASPDNQQIYHLPIKCPEIVAVGHHFYLLPLAGLPAQLETFYILTLSSNHVRMLRANLFGCQEMPISGLPSSLDQALWFKETEKTTRISHRGQGGSHHGEGADTRSSDPDKVTFVQMIDAAVIQRLGADGPPLVVAAAEPLAGLWTRISRYKKLMPALEGNPDHLSTHQIHSKASAIMRPILENRGQAELNRFQALAGQNSGQAISDPAAILHAAKAGRIDTLLYDESARQPATIFGETLLAGSEPNVLDDLADESLRQTLLTGGRVWRIKNHLDSNLVAILRY